MIDKKVVNAYRLARGSGQAFSACFLGVGLGMFPVGVGLTVVGALLTGWSLRPWGKKKSTLGEGAWIFLFSIAVGAVQMGKVWALVAAGMGVVCFGIAVAKDSEIPAEIKSLLRVWYADLDQPLRQFPVNGTMRRKIIPWARHDILEPLALSVVAAREERASIHAKEWVPAREALLRAVDDPSPCSPREQALYQGRIVQAQKAVRRTEKRYEAMLEHQERLQKKLLRLWEFFTEAEPGGISVLVYPEFGFPNLESFIASVAAEAASSADDDPAPAA